MKVETLDELKAAFDDWRSKKRHAREPVPSELRRRAHRASDVYGLGVVAKAMKLDQARLKSEHARRGERSEAGPMAPSYSRMELAPPRAAAERPFAEVETPAGVKVRLFASTAEAVGLVTSLLAMGGAR
jgi:hypothetical protein